MPPVHLSQAKKRQKRKEIRQEGRADSAQSERGDLKGFVPPSRLLVLMRHKKAIKDAVVSEEGNMRKVEVGGDGGHRGESRHA